MRYIFLVTLKQHKYRVVQFPRALSPVRAVSCATARSIASEVRVRNSCVRSEVGGRVYAPPLQTWGYALILCIFWRVSMASDDITATTYHKHPYL